MLNFGKEKKEGQKNMTDQGKGAPMKMVAWIDKKKVAWIDKKMLRGPRERGAEEPMEGAAWRTVE